MRNTYAMNPPTIARNMPVNMYCMAITLWSVDQQYLMNQFVEAAPWAPTPWRPSSCGAACACSVIGSPSVLGARGQRGGGVGGCGAGLGERGVLLHPGGMLRRRLDHDPRAHETVPDTADLGAQDVELARLRGLEPARDVATGIRVLLEPEDRHEEAVHDVLRFEQEVVGLAHGDVQRVARPHVVGGVEHAVHAGMLERPRPLLSHDADRVVRRRHRLLHLHPPARHGDAGGEGGGGVGVVFGPGVWGGACGGIFPPPPPKGPPTSSAGTAT